MTKYRARPIATTGIAFLVLGVPRPKQSFRYSKKGNYQPQRVTDWQEAVAWEAKQAMKGNDPFEGPISMRCVFILNHQRRVDIDNLNKAVMDAMNGIVFEDDQQVINLHLVKKYHQSPGAIIEVYPSDVLPPFGVTEFIELKTKR